MLNGHNKEKDRESQERLIIMRNIMFSNLVSHQKGIKKPTDVMQFDFEKRLLVKMDEEEYAAFIDEIEQVKAFYADQDAKKK